MITLIYRNGEIIKFNSVTEASIFLNIPYVTAKKHLTLKRIFKSKKQKAYMCFSEELKNSI